MSSPIKRIPTISRKTVSEQEREQFERSQEASFRKAINDEEVAVKMKHARNLIIGTHMNKNGAMFWRLVSHSPPLHTDITAWKFCHALHLILRDGHQKALLDSIEHRNRIKNLGEHFRHLPSGYGRLIHRYCDLLKCKLTFHNHYPGFPGALQITNDRLSSMAENDPNTYFDLTVEMLEYLENVLKLYEAVFNSLDPSRANSMTKLGQCRLAPLIPCIQDSSALYDIIVRIMFKLHQILPVDMLSGHRDRFNLQFSQLKTFYDSTRNLQYFKSLIQVPHLPQMPPNFLVQAELFSHVAPVVVLEEDNDPIDSCSVLVETASESEPPPIPPHPHIDKMNDIDKSLLEVLAERESLIESLQEELRATRNECQRIRSEASYANDQMRLKIQDLEAHTAELASELQSEQESKSSVLAQIEAAAASAEAAAASAEAVNQLVEEETKRRLAEDKFIKIKEVYQKLRDEHIQLIRKKAEIEKAFSYEKELHRNAQSDLDESERKRSEAQKMEHSQLQQSLKEANELNRALDESVSALTHENKKLMAENDTFKRSISELKMKMSDDEIKYLEKFEDQKRHINDDQQLAIVAACQAALTSIAYSLDHFDSELHNVIKATPEYTLLYQTPIINAIQSLSSSYAIFLSTEDNAANVIKDLGQLGHLAASFLLYAKATSHTAPVIDTAENLVSQLESFSRNCGQIFENVLESKDIKDVVPLVHKELERCFHLVIACQDLSPSQEDISLAIDKEMDKMNDAIQEAAIAFGRMLDESRANDSGLTLEVNEGILASCVDLMNAVRLLVQRASELQTEIVGTGKSAVFPKEFYKRNHRWTQGLISGAKTVALACQSLVNAANQLVTGNGKFEEVIVASREIAASSMQLVMASKVKAGKDSQTLKNLTDAARAVSGLTGTVVATAQKCQDKVTVATCLDFSKLSLHSAKHLEMETLVKVLETEKELSVQRERLSALKRHHYQLAGEIEGWDEESMK